MLHVHNLVITSCSSFSLNFLSSSSFFFRNLSWAIASRSSHRRCWVFLVSDKSKYVSSQYANYITHLVQSWPKFSSPIAPHFFEMLLLWVWSEDQWLNLKKKNSSIMPEVQFLASLPPLPTISSFLLFPLLLTWPYTKRTQLNLSTTVTHWGRVAIDWGEVLKRAKDIFTTE